MPTFDVFVEGPVRGGPEAVRQLAQQMSKRYGLAESDLVARMTKGRFRVKGNIDESTANTYARHLESIGARVTISESRPTPPAGTPRVQTPPAGTPRVQTPPAGTPRVQTPPAGTPRVPTPPAGTPAAKDNPLAGTPLAELDPFADPAMTLAKPTAKSRRSQQQPPISGTPTASRSQPMSALPAPTRERVATPPTGLAAAFTSGDIPIEGLGALDTDSMALAAIDGTDDAKPNISFAPPKPAAKGGAKPKTPPRDGPLDLFEPPDSGAQEFKIDLATDELEARAKKQTPPPQPVVETGLELEVAPSAPSTSATLQKKPATEPRVTATPSAGVTAVRQPQPRGRFAAGVFVAVVLGFVPAHCVASAREDKADKVIDDAVIVVQDEATASADAYAKLDEFRDEQLAAKRAKHRSIALTSMLIWAIVAAGLGFAWFWLVPWGRLEARRQSSSSS